MKIHSIALVAVLFAVGCKGPASQDAGASGEKGAAPAGKSGAAAGEQSRTAQKSEPAAVSEPAPAPTPESTPEPTPEPIVVPAGTSLVLVIESAVSSATARAGDEVRARLGESVKAGGEVTLERDSVVTGHVVSAKRSGKVKGLAELHVEFDTIEVNGRSYKIDATSVDETANPTKGR